jgi:transcriptional regulator with XRE-family HTH domain
MTVPVRPPPRPAPYAGLAAARARWRACGLRDREFAARLGVTPPHLSRLVRGRAWITDTMGARIAETLARLESTPRKETRLPDGALPDGAPGRQSSDQGRGRS